MVNLKELFAAIHEGTEFSSHNELKTACELIIRVQAMDAGERDTIRAAFKNGPLSDGNVPSKSSRDSLLTDGFISKVIVVGDWGYNALTYKGGYAYKLLEAGA